MYFLSDCYIGLKFLASVVDYTAYGNSIPFTYIVLLLHYFLTKHELQQLLFVGVWRGEGE